MLFSPKLITGTRHDPVCTAILTNPCSQGPGLRQPAATRAICLIKGGETGIQSCYQTEEELMLWTANTLLQTNHRPSRRGSNVCTRTMRGKHHSFAQHYLELLLLGQQGLPCPTHTQHNRPPMSSASNAQHATPHKHNLPSLYGQGMMAFRQLTQKECLLSGSSLSRRRAHFFSMLMHVCFAQSAMPCCSSTSLTKGVKKFCTSVNTWNVNPWTHNRVSIMRQLQHATRCRKRRYCR